MGGPGRTCIYMMFGIHVMLLVVFGFYLSSAFIVLVCFVGWMIFILKTMMELVCLEKKKTFDIILDAGKK